MILCITDVVSYRSIICMILVYDTLYYDQPKYNSALYMAFLHMWRKERQGKSGEVGSHARASLYYSLHGGALGEAPVWRWSGIGRLTPVVASQLK